MSILQDQVPAQPFSVIRAILDSELDFEKTFQSFESEPIGAASIGQVHRAVLKDGRRVVVKVCYPNVERLLRGDVRTIKMFAQVAQPVHVPGLEEMENQFQTGKRRQTMAIAMICAIRVFNWLSVSLIIPLHGTFCYAFALLYLQKLTRAS